MSERISESASQRIDRSDQVTFLILTREASLTHFFSLGSPTSKLIGPSASSAIIHDRPKRSATIPRHIGSAKWEYNRSRGTTMSDERLDHLSGNEQAALDTFVSQLREQYGDQVVRVALFGSKARGDGDAESDLDVLIVLNDGDWRLRDAVALVAFEPMIEYGVVLSPLVVDMADYTWWQEHHAPIYRSVSAEGVELWTRQPSPSFESA